MRKIENCNQCQNLGFDGLKDYTDLNILESKKSVQSASSVAIRDSDNMQAEINQYLNQLVK
jgi:hypothetical protein